MNEERASACLSMPSHFQSAQHLQATTTDVYSKTVKIIWLHLMHPVLCFEGWHLHLVKAQAGPVCPL